MNFRSWSPLPRIGSKNRVPGKTTQLAAVRPAREHECRYARCCGLLQSESIKTQFPPAHPVPHSVFALTESQLAVSCRIETAHSGTRRFPDLLWIVLARIGRSLHSIFPYIPSGSLSRQLPEPISAGIYWRGARAQDGLAQLMAGGCS